MEIQEYNNSQLLEDQKICDLLMKIIDSNLDGSTSKLWHGAPVWFLDGNPVVGYSKQKGGVRLMFWSGADFGEENLIPGTGKFKDASIFYNSTSEINDKEIKVWLKKAKKSSGTIKTLLNAKGNLSKYSTNLN